MSAWAISKISQRLGETIISFDKFDIFPAFLRSLFHSICKLNNFSMQRASVRVERWTFVQNFLTSVITVVALIQIFFLGLILIVLYNKTWSTCFLEGNWSPTIAGMRSPTRSLVWLVIGFEAMIRETIRCIFISSKDILR